MGAWGSVMVKALRS